MEKKGPIPLKLIKKTPKNRLSNSILRPNSLPLIWDYPMEVKSKSLKKYPILDL